VIHFVLTLAMDRGNQFIIPPVNSPWCSLCSRLSITHRGRPYRESNCGRSPRSLVMVPVLLVELCRENVEFKLMWLHCSRYTMSVTRTAVALNIFPNRHFAFPGHNKEWRHIFRWFFAISTIVCRLLLPALILSLASLLQTPFHVLTVPHSRTVGVYGRDLLPNTLFSPTHLYYNSFRCTHLF
jgi:hypothetical protein